MVANIGKTFIFPWLFIGLCSMSPLIRFPIFWMEYLCFARISIITKHRDGALVVVVGSKYGESIHFSKFFRGLAMPPLIPKKDILQV